MSVDTKLEEFVCTRCMLRFECDDEKCPECGDTYGHFCTALSRANSFALAYWWRDKLNRNPDAQIRSVVPNRETT